MSDTTNTDDAATTFRRLRERTLGQPVTTPEGVVLRGIEAMEYRVANKTKLVAYFDHCEEIGK